MYLGISAASVLVGIGADFGGQHGLLGMAMQLATYRTIIGK